MRLLPINILRHVLVAGLHANSETMQLYMCIGGTYAKNLTRTRTFVLSYPFFDIHLPTIADELIPSRTDRKMLGTDDDLRNRHAGLKTKKDI